MSEGKTCTKCGEWKELEEFYRRSDAKIGRQSHCKVCKHRYNEENRGKERGRTRRYYIKNREKKLGKGREYYFKKAHGITLVQLERLKDFQNNRCAICMCVLPNGRNAHVDHCHNSDNIRGVLCSTCNQALGHLKDDPQIVERARKYLLKHKQMRVTA